MVDDPAASTAHPRWSAVACCAVCTLTLHVVSSHSHGKLAYTGKGVGRASRSSWHVNSAASTEAAVILRCHAQNYPPIEVIPFRTEDKYDISTSKSHPARNKSIRRHEQNYPPKLVNPHYEVINITTRLISFSVSQFLSV